MKRVIKESINEEWDGENKRVCVDVHGLPGFDDYMYCSLNGIVCKKKDKTFDVKLDIGKRVKDIEGKRISKTRLPEDNVFWEKGDKIEVLHVLRNKQGKDPEMLEYWWKATVIDPNDQNEVKIKWMGKYENHKDIQYFNSAAFRLSK